MSAEATSTTPQLATGEAIEYKAYTRTFGEGPAAVLYLIATCAYPVGGYQIFFEGEEGLENFRLMEIAPRIFPELVSYYIASWTTGLLLAEPPTQIQVTDAYGTQPVPVVPWD
jgi:hypothetical protein